MKADPADRSFTEGMADLLGYDDDQIDTVLSLLSPDELIDLADCVSQDDRPGAVEIIKSAAIDEDDEDKRKLIDGLEKTNKKHKTELNDDDINYGVGDDIKLEGDEDATVCIPQGPGGTVGVMIGGKIKMVTRNEIKRVDESDDTSLLGISIDRIRKLAGLGAQSLAPDSEHEQQQERAPTDAEAEGATGVPGIPGSVEVEVVGQPEDQDMQGDAEGEIECPVQRATDALDALASALPDIKLGDLKAIRAKLSDVQMKMNEDARRLPLGRKPKLS